MSRIGVGLIGAGAVAQSIHVPALARLSDRLKLMAGWDLNPDTADLVAHRASARSTASLADLLDDPAVEIVGICTPGAAHADHVIAAMRAGKRAILCEKPLATTIEDAQRIAAAAAETGVPLIVGAMHVFDPAWLSVAEDVERIAPDARLVRSSIVLPFNARFETFATESTPRPAPVRPSDGDPRLRLIRSCVMELAIHDLPIVRRFLPDATAVEVTAARFMPPFGYAITLRAPNRLIDLFGFINNQWQPRWDLSATSADVRLDLTFTPSFVHAGSGTAIVTRAGEERRYAPAVHNGYEGEWRTLLSIVEGAPYRAPGIADMIADLRFAIAIADQAVGFIEREIAA